MRSNRLRMQILSLSRFNPHHIRIKMDMVPRPESGLFSVVDKLLANAEKTPALQTVSLRFSGSAHKELRRDGPCVVELLTGLFSACVERGVCGRVCDPDICPLHGHLRQWESVVTTTHTPQACQDEKVEELLRHGGVPPSLRPRVWAYLTHSASKRIDGLYADMEKQTSRLLLSDTNRDVANFARRHTELSSSMLTKILKAFLAFSKAPYTPNLVSIAGLILLQTPNPEDAFWTFTSLMTTHLSAFQSRIEEHATLVAKHLETKDPELATKLFIDLAILPVSLFRPWFANVFVGTLPDEHLLHVWDWLLYQGPEFLLRTAVAILTLDDVKTALLEADSQAAAMTIVLDLPASLLPKEAEVFVGKVFTVKW
ncbi:rab-GTPase-TBC domain-containing protein [Cristinia sonorae]|uniref:Rab-GTPase-TBC domain-containing protein n=1 Tax=Cristinia sonorae TaxID=1940300 RepID=A0A8K0UPD7_9AGAR|nr:rab-GTPase-TBC domain-containing protein [Cristinia sonorae]